MKFLRSEPAGASAAAARAEKRGEPRRRSERIVSLAVIVALTVILFAFALPFSARRSFWYDELFTYYVSNLPGMGVVWTALKAGADNNPPLMYGAVKLARMLPIPAEMAARLPALAGMWLMSVCVFVFVRRILGPAAGSLAVLLIWSTDIYPFGYEARPYGIVLGGFSLALMSWQAAAAREAGRTWALAGTVIGLSTALLAHCYAVLLFLPLGLGELVRTARLRTIDKAVWAALMLPSVLVGLYIPLMTGASHLLTNTWARPRWSQSYGYYASMFEPAAGILVILLSLLCVFTAAGWSARRMEEQERSFAPHETAALLGLLMLPVAGLVLATTVTGIFAFRYAAAAVLAPCILIAAIVARVAGRRLAWGAAGLMLGWHLFTTGGMLFNGRAPGGTVLDARPDQQLRALASASENTVVIANGHDFVELSHYAAPELAARIVYVRDPAAAVKYTGSDTTDRGLPSIQRWFGLPMNVIDYREFVASHREFLVYAKSVDTLNWIVPKLKADGAAIGLEKASGGPDGAAIGLEKASGGRVVYRVRLDP